jgi:hypothetical protein
VKVAGHLAMKRMNIADVCEVLEHSESTIACWLERAGWHSGRLHEHWFKNLALRHIQPDELVTRVRGGDKKKAQLLLGSLPFGLSGSDERRQLIGCGSATGNCRRYLRSSSQRMVA